jgi:hypothetical protein
MQETESAARQEDVWVEHVRAARAQGLGLRADAGRVHFPGALVLEWAGAADLALIERLCRLGPGAP